ncbi:MAG: SulP family inorganic anion transporter [Actinomycetaceae bacterium]|nr:SulP family inorganic anion transporter [Actinomycetaceae bacterium]
MLAALKSPKRMKTEILGGLLVAIALIPEAIAFAIIAGVDPRVGLYASFLMAVTTAIVGGRPALISAATGAVALVIAPVSREFGMDYFLATVMLAGIIQIILAALGVAKMMRFIPRMVMVGFVNALAILVALSQLPHLIGPDIPWIVYPMVIASLVIIYLFPMITDIVPSGLVAVVVITVAVQYVGWDIPTVGDQGALPDSLPSLVLPSVPLTFETLKIIAPFSFAMALVGLMESLLTSKLVDDITDTHSDKTRVCAGQGIANIVSSLFGAMGGCAVVGQTMINVKASGARTRISTFLSGVFLLILVVLLGDYVAMIPMATLVGVMIMVCITTFNWHSVKPSTMRRMPFTENLIMIITVIFTVATNNLAYGVITGVITATLVLARRISRFSYVEKIVDEENPDVQKYRISGQLFFASSNDLVYQFDYKRDPGHIVIDMSDAHLWDSSAIATLDAIEQKYMRHKKTVEIVGLNEISQKHHDLLSGQMGED